MLLNTQIDALCSCRHHTITINSDEVLQMMNAVQELAQLMDLNWTY